MGDTSCDLKSFESTPVLETPAPARVKVLHSMLTTGPAMRAEILSIAENRLRIQVPRLIVVGSTVQIRNSQRVAFGIVHSSVPIGLDCEIEVNVERSS